MCPVVFLVFTVDGGVKYKILVGPFVLAVGGRVRTGGQRIISCPGNKLTA